MFDRDQLTMPTENRVRTKHGWDFEEPLAADSLALHRESSSLIVGESRALAIVKFEENSVLFDQEIDDVILLSIEPS